MKKIFSAVLIIALAFTASACGGRGPANTVYSAQDAKGKIIGVLSGSSSLPYAKELGETAQYSSQQLLMDALKSGSLDCVVMERLIGDKLARRTSHVRTLPEPLLQYDLCFAVAKEHVDLTNAINAAIRTLISSGAIDGFYDKHFNGVSYEFTPSSAPTPEGTLILAVPPDYPPYAYKNADGEYAGIDIDVARAVCALIGVSLDIIEEEMPRLVTTVQYGKADFSLGGVHINEADGELVDFSISYAQLIQVLIVRT